MTHKTNTSLQKFAICNAICITIGRFSR